MAQHLVLNCETGEETVWELPPEEEAERAAQGAASAEAERRAREVKDADLQMLAERARDDPAFAALCRHLGVL